MPRKSRTGACRLAALHELVLTLQGFEAEFLALPSESLVKLNFSTLLEINGKTPLSKTVSICAAVLIGGDVFFSALDKKTPPEQIAAKVSAFFKYSTSELRLAKKEIPKPLADRLDKQAKDGLFSFLVFFCFNHWFSKDAACGSRKASLYRQDTEKQIGPAILPSSGCKKYATSSVSACSAAFPAKKAPRETKRSLSWVGGFNLFGGSWVAADARCPHFSYFVIFHVCVVGLLNFLGRMISCWFIVFVFWFFSTDFHTIIGAAASSISVRSLESPRQSLGTMYLVQCPRTDAAAAGSQGESCARDWGAHSDNGDNKLWCWTKTKKC